MLNADEREDWHNAVEAADWYVAHKTTPLYGIPVHYQTLLRLRDRLERLEAALREVQRLYCLQLSDRGNEGFGDEITDVLDKALEERGENEQVSQEACCH